MLGPFFGILGVFLILILDELLWRLKVVRGELSRQIVHIAVGTYIAFWPFVMSMKEIQILAVAMLVVVSISRRYHIFQSIHAVKRRTYGEFFFPISVGLVALMTESGWVFAAAVMHLSVADGLASYVGSTWGKSSAYKILGQNKSWIGTLTFFVSSLLIITTMLVIENGRYEVANTWLALCLPLVATVSEGLAVYGTDDLVVPLIVAGILESLKGIA
jgi:phytol kinase